MAEQHVNPEEAVMIFEALQAQRAIGIHWGVFRLSDEGWAEPREALTRALAERKIEPKRFEAGGPGYVWSAQA
jgi:L-ascorbate metabolism protein UlaG (beta-lactamase superfamily)